MASNAEFQQLNFSNDDSNVVEHQVTVQKPEPTHTNGAGSSARNGPLSPISLVSPRTGGPPRAESHEFARGSVVSDNTSLDKIETQKSDDGGAGGNGGNSSDANQPKLTFTDTIKQATHDAKRKMYIHHRNQRRLSKQFTAGSALEHMPWMKHDKPKTHDDPEAQDGHHSDKSLSFLTNVKIMFTTFPYWNMAFWSGWCYSIGSALFVIDGVWAWAPLQWPKSEFKGEEKYGVPLLFFFGAILYQIGGVMAYLEAVNDGSFAGAAMKNLFEGHLEMEKEFLDAKLHTFFGHVVPHHHREDDHKHANTDNHVDCHWDSLQKKDTRPEDVIAETKKMVERRGGFDQGAAKEKQEGEVREYLTWRWWPSWHNFKSYHIFELGYLACAIQLFGVTLYGITSIVILPGIYDSLAFWQLLGAYWVPQIVASCCFLIASIMFTIMAQENWYVFKVGAVSWWIGMHAIIGSMGFLLTAIFGIVGHTYSWGNYQSPLSSTWGSLFYMLSGLFQWYEAINVNVGPVLAFPNNRTPVLLRRKK